MYNEMEYQEEYRMADLIRRQWLGIITAEEQAELEAWSLQEEHARLYAKIRNQAELQKRNLYVDGLDVDGVWHKLREQIADVPVRKRRFFTCYRVVACLLLLIGVGTLLVYNRYSRLQPSDLLVQSIHPGSSKAVLITNEGKQIILQDSLNQEIQVDESVTVKNTGLLAEYCLQDLQAAEQAEIKYNTIVVPRGGEYEVRLPDGSYVWMNADSEIRFPTRFRGNKREVYLSGEAYFEVHHDPSRPFYVKTTSLDVKVLGTSFNVKAYDDMDAVETSLVEGVISVKDNVLRPNMQAVFDKNTGNFSYRKINGDNYRLRKERIFVFENQRLDDILQEMARWYDFDIFYQNPDIADKQFGLKLEKYEHVDSLLKMLELTGEVKFSMKGKILIVMSGSE